MKNLKLSAVIILSLGAFAVAGGDIAPVEPEVVTPEPAVCTPAPIVEDDSGPYIGIAYSRANWTEDSSGDDGKYSLEIKNEIDYNAIMGQVGYKFNKYFAIEGRYWGSVGNNDWSSKGTLYYSDTGEVVGGWDQSGNDDDRLNAWGVYAKPMYPLTEKLDIYVLAGYGNAKLNNDSQGTWFDENCFQWGGGLSYGITENLFLFADYVYLADKKGLEEDVDFGGFYGDVGWKDKLYTINAGLTYKF